VALPVHERDAPVAQAVWGEARHLHERVTLELVELCDSRVELRHCRLCGAVFAPVKNEVNCRFGLWDADTHAAIREWCDEDALKRLHNEGNRREHTRTRRRLATQARRMRNQYGADHPLTERATTTHRRYMEEHGRKRGPKPLQRPVAPP
jgi:hypothetical protein